jgi:coenzyme F420-0:L-glutamate ligase / coenzyme F420-1:gamma-L-glutamate ligase
MDRAEENYEREIKLLSVKTKLLFRRFDLAKVVSNALDQSGITLRNGDILIVSSKFAAVSEGRVVSLSGVIPGRRAKDLAALYNVEASLAQLVLNESREVVGGIPGYLLAVTRQGILATNAGIDRSNSRRGFVVLYPRNPAETARALRAKLLKISLRRANHPEAIKDLGVILSDSRVTPMRLGSVGIAIGASGLRQTLDDRGSTDLFGNKLKVTLRAVGDQLATAAQLLMGESDKLTPIVLVRGFKDVFRKPRNRFENTSVISAEKCLIISGLRANKKF